MHLVGFIIRIYHYARSPGRQMFRFINHSIYDEIKNKADKAANCYIHKVLESCVKQWLSNCLRKSYTYISYPGCTYVHLYTS